VLPDELRHPRQTLDRAVRSADAARLVADFDRRLTRYRRDRKLGQGTFRGMRVVVHRGYVVGDEVRVHLRVMEEPAIPEAGDGLPMVSSAKQNVRRFMALGLPQVPAVVRVGDAVTEVVTGRRGFAAATLQVPGLAPGWHPVQVDVPPEDADHDGASGEGRVLVPDPAAPFAVVSDLDDTVVRSRVTEGINAFTTTLFGDANTRAAVPGMASLYRGLAGTPHGLPARESSGGASGVPSFFYVSTGSWSMYPVLTGFLHARGFPPGPLFLTDWGPTDRYIIRSGAEHKGSAIARLVEGYPGTRVVFIGDSGQGDPEVYLQIARAHPEQVAAILIVDVGAHLAERAEAVTAMAEAAQAEGIPFHFVRDARRAAEVAIDLGLADPRVVEEVETELLALG
jgi:phosphatidate phosphatase APP1